MSVNFFLIEYVGGLAQSEECVVSNDEAPGSKPGFSIFWHIIFFRISHFVFYFIILIEMGKK